MKAFTSQTGPGFLTYRATAELAALGGRLAAESPAIDFTADVLPILEGNCTPCHAGDFPTSGPLLETVEAYDNVVDVPSLAGGVIGQLPVSLALLL